MTHDDQIRLVGLGGVGRHGVLAEERREGQTFLVDVTMHTDTRDAAATDDLERTVDYAAVAADVVAVIEGEPVALIETLAARIADVVLSRPTVRRVEVTVHKPEAPVGVPFSDVQVSIVRDAASGSAADVDVDAAHAAPAPPLPVAIPSASAAPDEGVPSPGDLAQDEPDVVPHEAAPADALDDAPAEAVDVVLALGGNVGDVRDTLRRAIDELGEQDGVTVRTVSPLARTAAVLQADAVGQPDYLNVVVLVTTTRSPLALLEVMQGIEASHGRRRAERWGERTLDIDVVVYGSLSSADPRLTLPHPRANERAFVLVPWAQVQPDAFLPGLGGGPVAALAETAPDRGGVRWLALDWYDEGAARSRAAAVDAVAPGPQQAVSEEVVDPAPASTPGPVPAEGDEVVPAEGDEVVPAAAGGDAPPPAEVDGAGVSADTAEAFQTAHGFDDDPPVVDADPEGGEDLVPGHESDADGADDQGQDAVPAGSDDDVDPDDAPVDIDPDEAPADADLADDNRPPAVPTDSETPTAPAAPPAMVEPVEPTQMWEADAPRATSVPDETPPAPLAPAAPVPPPPPDAEQTVRAQPPAPAREPWDIPAPDPGAPRLRPRWAPVNREGGED